MPSKYGRLMCKEGGRVGTYVYKMERFVRKYTNGQEEGFLKVVMPAKLFPQEVRVVRKRMFQWVARWIK